MKIKWKRLLTIICVVLVTASVTGGTIWAGYTEIINNQKAQISSLQAQADSLSKQAIKRAEEEKEVVALAKAEAAARAAEEATKQTTPVPAQNDPVQEVSQSQILYFYNPACGACVAQEPAVRQLQDAGVPVAFMNLENRPDYISTYNIEYTPTFILNGERKVGVFTKSELLEYWNAYK